MCKKIFYLCSLLLFLNSCSDDEFGMEEKPSPVKKSSCGVISLGEKEESPLLLRNMQRAVDSLSARSGLKSTIVLKPTHYYVRFLPEDSAAYERVIKDTSLFVTSYPLDYEVSEGETYHDPSVPEDKITWQYTVVPVDYDLSSINVHYEKLEDLYIQNEDLDSEENVAVDGIQLKSGTSMSHKITWKQLVNESISQTTGETNSLKSKWTPQATIRAYDDIVGGFIPLQGVKVRIRYFAFLHAYHYTDAYGHVSFSKKRTKVEYSIEWERDKWDIRDNHVQAYYNGPHKKSSWDLYIGTWTPKSLHYSAIHRALYKYYYGNCLGLTRPSRSLKIAYREGYGDANGETFCFLVRNLNGLVHSINIYGKGSKSHGVRSVSEVLSTTLHELAHASHMCRINTIKYENHVRKYIRESYASLVQWQLTIDLYKNYVDKTQLEAIDELYGKQNWPNNSKNYTPLFIDMLDSCNQSKKGELINEDIYGYNLLSIDKSLTSLEDIDDVKDFMKKAKPGHVSEKQINNFINQYKKAGL